MEKCTYLGDGRKVKKNEERLESKRRSRDIVIQKKLVIRNCIQKAQDASPSRISGPDLPQAGPNTTDSKILFACSYIGRNNK